MTRPRVEVAIVGLGPMGVQIARQLLSRPDYAMAAAADTDSQKSGRDLGQLVGSTDSNVIVSSRLDAQPRANGVCVLCTSSSLESVSPQIESLAQRGWRVLSTCEELSEPWSKPELANRLDALARRHGISILGTGVNPGYLMDTLPLMLSTCCARIDRVMVRRSVDTNNRRIPLQEKAGVGLDVPSFQRRVQEGSIGHIGLRQSARLVAAGLGWRLDGWHEAVVPVIAVADIETGRGRVKEGHTIGLTQSAVGSDRGRELVRYELQMFAGAMDTDEVFIGGKPNLQSTIVGGLNGDSGTAAIVVNLVRYLATAPVGLLTMRDAMPLAGYGGVA